ncbi:MAG TPA: phosphopantetheine-binding protein [Lysobacter sp.]|jgi:acyl carrier protein|nr:phosphopantetheine-binding protein [Lysobacter sp.]
MGTGLAQVDLVGEVAELVVAAVGLDTPPGSIDPDMRLFGEGLGLDSIDMLEIALAITQKYGFQLRSDNPDNEQIFASLRTLTAHVALNRVR